MSTRGTQPQRVIIAGHWDSDDARTTSDILAEIAQGFTAERPNFEVVCIPFGPSAAFREAVDSSSNHRWAPIVVPSWAEDTYEAGCQTRAALEDNLTPVIEGGHQMNIDAGLGFLRGLTGIDTATDPATLILEALTQARTQVKGRDLVVAASSMRPLLGMASVYALNVDLSPRPHQDREFTALLTDVLAQMPASYTSLPVTSSLMPHSTGEVTHPGKRPGSGAAGGIGAIVASIGGRIVPTGNFLRDVTHLDDELAQAQLVIVVEPRLHSPLLAEATLDTVTTVAAQFAVPTVAIGWESSLSNHERAQWGLHGIMVAKGNDSLRDSGRRIAHTWTQK